MKMCCAVATAALLISACKKEGKGEEKAAAADPTATVVEPVAPPPPSFPDDRPAHGKASITGVIRYEGKVPDPVPVDFSFDPACKPLMDDPFVREVEVDGKGGLKNVFLYVRKGLPKDAKYDVPEGKIALANTGCRFIPYMIGFRKGQDFELVNNDNIGHMFRMQESKREFSKSAGPPGTIIPRGEMEPQVLVQVWCDIHPWMKSYVAVLEHPFYAQTGADGAFKLDGLPPGHYDLEFWHPTLGIKKGAVTLPDNESTQAIEIKFADTDLPKPGRRKILPVETGHLGWE